MPLCADANVIPLATPDEATVDGNDDIGPGSTDVVVLTTATITEDSVPLEDVSVLQSQHTEQLQPSNTHTSPVNPACSDTRTADPTTLEATVETPSLKAESIRTVEMSCAVLADSTADVSINAVVSSCRTSCTETTAGASALPGDVDGSAQRHWVSTALAQGAEEQHNSVVDGKEVMATGDSCTADAQQYPGEMACQYM